MLARFIGFVASPRPDRLHEKPTPFLGGLALVLALAGGLVAAGRLTGPTDGAPLGLANAPTVTLLFVLATFAFLLGLVDDWRTLSPPAKLSGQVALAVAFLSVAGTGPFDSPVLDGVLGIIWIAGLMNACNFLDNMDGALGGAALPAAVGLGLLSVRPDTADLGMILGAAIAGFLAWNRPPARIFLGDSGSLLIGGALALTGWTIASESDALAGWLALPVIVAWPIFDMTFVTVTRLRRGQSPWVGGRDHTTHRLATRLGSAIRAFFVVLLVSALAATLGVMSGRAGTTAAAFLLAGAIVAFGAAGVALSRVGVR
ncbi:MAG TPA: MraY family glycosyltransferase [Candidatus Eisenbacteria bacterium]